MSSERDYIRDGAEIYRRSFAIIRAEADLARFSREEEQVAVRIVHACGMVETAADHRLRAGRGRSGPRRAARPARRSSAIRNGRQRNYARETAGGQRGDLHARRSAHAELARKIGNTRTAAAMELWRDRLGGVVVAIGNAPTALFRLLDMIDAGAPKPAAIIGMPVGFVGAAESKEALIAHDGLSVARGARPQGRQRHDGGGDQRAGERGGMSGRSALWRRPRPGRSGARHGQRGAAGARAPRRRLFRQERTRAATRARIADRWLDRRCERADSAVLSDDDGNAFRRPDLHRRARRLSTTKRRALAAHLEAGRDVALLCEGDPMFYGSFMHLYERLSRRFRVEVVRRRLRHVRLLRRRRRSR